MKKKTTKNSKLKTYHLLMYVLDSNPKIKRFDSMDKMEKFINKFHKDHPEHLSMESGDWIDYCVFGVTGEVCFYTDGITVE